MTVKLYSIPYIDRNLLNGGIEIGHSFLQKKKENLNEKKECI